MQINLAYEVLSDPEKKANNDKFGNTNQNNYFKDNLFQGFKDFFIEHIIFLKISSNREKKQKNQLIKNLVKKILIFLIDFMKNQFY